jgi:hypothetical protein
VIYLGRLWPYPKNIRLGWKDLSGTNTLAYHENSQIRTVKRFYNIGPWAEHKKSFIAADLYIVTAAVTDIFVKKLHR